MNWIRKRADLDEYVIHGFRVEGMDDLGLDRNTEYVFMSCVWRAYPEKSAVYRCGSVWEQRNK